MFAVAAECLEGQKHMTRGLQDAWGTFSLDVQGLSMDLFVVCDGHGPRGDQVARYVVSTLPSCLLKELKDIPKDVSIATGPDKTPQLHIVALYGACSRAVEAVDESLRAHDVDLWTRSGTTLVAALHVISDYWIFINVGDSRAALCTYDEFVDDTWAIHVTLSHDTRNATELERLAALGALVKPDTSGGTVRVWERSDPLDPGVGLAMTRSLGDGAHRAAGVVPYPSVSLDVINDHSTLVLATDGLWDVSDLDSVAQAVSLAWDVRTASRTLAWRARAAWNAVWAGAYVDDITVMVIRHRRGDFTAASKAEHTVS